MSPSDVKTVLWGVSYVLSEIQLLFVRSAYYQTSTFLITLLVSTVHSVPFHSTSFYQQAVLHVSILAKLAAIYFSMDV